MLTNIEKKRILDIGGAFGTDLRQMALDGANTVNLFCLDIEPRYVKLGFDLFKDSKTYHGKFFRGNLAEDVFIFEVTQNLEEKYVTKSDLGLFDAIYASSVLHLLSEHANNIFIKEVFTLLNTGGVFFGKTGGSIKPQIIRDHTHLKFYHSRESLFQILDEVGFSEIEINSSPFQIHAYPSQSFEANVLEFHAKK